MSGYDDLVAVLDKLKDARHALADAERAYALAEKTGYEFADGKTAEVRKAQAAEFCAEAKAAVDRCHADVEFYRRLHDTMLAFLQRAA